MKLKNLNQNNGEVIRDAKQEARDFQSHECK